MSIELVMPFNHCILCFPLLILPSIFPSIRIFPMSRLFASVDQGIGASASVLPMNIQGWFPLGLDSLISLLSKRLSRVFSSTTVEKQMFLVFLVASFLGKNMLHYSFSWRPKFPHIFNLSSLMGLNKAVNLKLDQIVSVVSLRRELIPFLYLRAKPKVEKHNLKHYFWWLNTYTLLLKILEVMNIFFYSINLLCLPTFLTWSYKKGHIVLSAS